ncbi:GIY-YIG nuclease family protein [Kitasatospora sp. NPDC127060]|uniref:GIY-YIG nuclease family protein n=1 Tax=Kitasatospora sp. NPDC127060 TaxID=3347121 RepID=UPI00365EAFD9
MTRKEFFDEAELVARGWHPRRFRWFLGKPDMMVFGRGDLYAVADVVVAEADPEWPEQMRLEFEEDAELRRRCDENEARWKRVAARRTALYRLFDASGALLYVGITTDPKARFKGHRSGNGRHAMILR